MLGNARFIKCLYNIVSRLRFHLNSGRSSIFSDWRLYYSHRKYIKLPWIKYNDVVSRAVRTFFEWTWGIFHVCPSHFAQEEMWNTAQTLRTFERRQALWKYVIVNKNKAHMQWLLSTASVLTFESSHFSISLVSGKNNGNLYAPLTVNSFKSPTLTQGTLTASRKSSCKPPILPVQQSTELLTFTVS